MGGWQADLTSVGSVSLLPAAGVVLSSTRRHRDPDQRRQHWRTVRSRGAAAIRLIINNGTMTGFVTLAGRQQLS